MALDLVLQTHLLGCRLVAEKQKEGSEVCSLEALFSPAAQCSPQLQEVAQLGVIVGLLLSDFSDKTKDQREGRRSVIAFFLNSPAFHVHFTKGNQDTDGLKSAADPPALSVASNGSLATKTARSQ